MARGIEHRDVFYDDADREDFLERVARLATEGAIAVYAWALMPNHVHLLVRTGNRSLASSMRSLLGGYATFFNRRHKRVGHLFQNRYKSILCEEEAYFLTLVTYIHLNPLRSKLVGSLTELDSYPWTGHSALVNRRRRKWQDVGFVLETSSPKEYRQRLADHLTSDEFPDLDGGGLRRSVDGLNVVGTLLRGREGFRSDERILGSSTFMEAVLRELKVGQRKAVDETSDFQMLLESVSRSLGIRSSLVIAEGSSRAQVRARDGLAFLWVSGLGRSGRSLAPLLRLTSSAVYVAVKRGSRERDHWLALFESQTFHRNLEK